MGKKILDLTSVETKTGVENITRTWVLDALEKFLTENFEGAVRVGATEFAFPASIATDDEGFSRDVAAIISVKIPKFYDIKHENKPTTKRYEILNNLYLWENDSKSTKKKAKESEWIAIAREHEVEAAEVVYDFNELDPDSFD